MARQAVAAKGDPSVLDKERSQVTEALRLADLWLEDATEFPSGIRTIQAWSRSEWVEATLPVWSKLCDPIVSRQVEAMGGMLGDNPAELAADLPPEMRAAMTAMSGGLGGARRPGRHDAPDRRHDGRRPGRRRPSAPWPRRSSAPPTWACRSARPAPPPCCRRASRPSASGLEVSEDEVRLFLALREAAHHRLFAHVPWLRPRLLGAIEDYARGIKVDAAALRDVMPQIDPSNPEALNEALSGAALFQPEDTPEQKAALARLETLLALIEGWVATVVGVAAQNRLPQAGALAEAIRRRRAAGGPAERTFAELVGLELRPRRLREAATIWQGLTEERGTSGRDAIWTHPDLLPTADDFDDTDGFVRGRPELDISDLETSAGEDTPGPDQPDEGDDKPEGRRPDGPGAELTAARRFRGNAAHWLIAAASGGGRPVPAARPGPPSAGLAEQRPQEPPGVRGRHRGHLLGRALRDHLAAVRRRPPVPGR